MACGFLAPFPASFRTQLFRLKGSISPRLMESKETGTNSHLTKQRTSITCIQPSSLKHAPSASCRKPHIPDNQVFGICEILVSIHVISSYINHLKVNLCQAVSVFRHKSLQLSPHLTVHAVGRLAYYTLASDYYAQHRDKRCQESCFGYLSYACCNTAYSVHVVLPNLAK